MPFHANNKCRFVMNGVLPDGNSKLGYLGRDVLEALGLGLYLRVLLDVVGDFDHAHACCLIPPSLTAN